MIMDRDEELATKYEEGEAWNEDDVVVEMEIKAPLDKMITIRLSADRWEALRREAHELGIGPSTLARMWILEKLREIRTGGGAPHTGAVAHKQTHRQWTGPEQEFGVLGTLHGDQPRGEMRTPNQAMALPIGPSLSLPPDFFEQIQAQLPADAHQVPAAAIDAMNALVAVMQQNVSLFQRFLASQLGADQGEREQDTGETTAPQVTTPQVRN